MTLTVPEQVQDLLEVYNRKRGTYRFQSVDQVAADLGMPPRPSTGVAAWIDRVARAVNNHP